MNMCESCGSPLQTCGKCGWSKVYEEDLSALKQEIEKYKHYVDTTNYSSEKVAIKSVYLEIEIEQLKADKAELLECVGFYAQQPNNLTARACLKQIEVDK